MASAGYQRKDLKRLSRRELLELLLAETEELHRLRAENEQLQKELEERDYKLEKAGSIAMASLSLAGVFEAAQKAADAYLYNIRLLADRGELKPEDMEDAGGKPPEDKAEGGRSLLN